MKEKGFSNWTHVRQQRDNSLRIASEMGKKENQSWGSGSLLWDTHRAPQSTTAVGWRDTQEIPEALPVHSQPVGSVTGTRIALDKCHRESGKTIELPKARLSKCLAHTLSHGEGQNHLCHFRRRDREGLSQEALISPWPWQEKRRASEEPSAEGMGWFTESQRGKIKKNVRNSEAQRKRKSVCPVGRC